MSNLERAGTFALGGRTVNRLGYGAMQLAGPRAFGPPRDRDAALALLREAVTNGINHIDTSDFYGPHVTNQLIREALHPYPFPLGGFTPLQSSILSEVATRLGATPMQVALAWLLHRAPNILLIPGTSSIAHPHENLAAAELALTDTTVASLAKLIEKPSLFSTSTQSPLTVTRTRRAPLSAMMSVCPGKAGRKAGDRTTDTRISRPNGPLYPPSPYFMLALPRHTNPT